MSLLCLASLGGLRTSISRLSHHLRVNLTKLNCDSGGGVSRTPRVFGEDSPHWVSRFLMLKPRTVADLKENIPLNSCKASSLLSPSSLPLCFPPFLFHSSSPLFPPPFFLLPFLLNPSFQSHHPSFCLFSAPSPSFFLPLCRLLLSIILQQINFQK